MMRGQPYTDAWLELSSVISALLPRPVHPADVGTILEASLALFLASPECLTKLHEGLLEEMDEQLPWLGQGTTDFLNELLAKAEKDADSPNSTSESATQAASAYDLSTNTGDVDA